MNAWDGYTSGLTELVSLGQRQKTDQDKIEHSLATATNTAKEARHRTNRDAEATRRAIEAEQQRGKHSLSRIDQSGLLPARVRPAATNSAASVPTVKDAIARHTQAVSKLDTEIRAFELARREEAARRQAEAKRAAEDARRKTQEEEAERRRLAAAQARRRLLISIGAVAAAILLAALIIIAI